MRQPPALKSPFRFYGANLFANCVLALDADTGGQIWHFQAVRHDVWYRDLPSPPNLASIDIDGKSVAALAQIAKSGYIFILDRETGRPLFEVEEVPAPPSNLQGSKPGPPSPSR